MYLQTSSLAKEVSMDNEYLILLVGTCKPVPCIRGSFYGQWILNIFTKHLQTNYL